MMVIEYDSCFLSLDIFTWTMKIWYALLGLIYIEISLLCEIPNCSKFFSHGFISRKKPLQVKESIISNDTAV